MFLGHICATSSSWIFFFKTAEEQWVRCMRLNHKGFRWDNAHTIHSWQMIIHTLSKLLAMRRLYVSGWAVWYMDLPCPQRVKQCHTKYPQIPLSVSVYYPAASSEVNRWKKNETYMSAGFIKDNVDKFLLYRWLIVSATDTSMLQLNGLWSQMSEVVGFCCFEVVWEWAASILQLLK